MDTDKRRTLNNYAEFKEYLLELIDTDFECSIFGDDFVVVNGKRIEFSNIQKTNHVR